ncbi:MAG: zinc ribbon domain-containing protein [Leptolinea sp.]|jgi:hypothetical protein|nr:zinc ribbon domain-containing protein [Leptolinea sp.]
MNRIVKILLTILAVLIIAGAGFWSGTRFGANQTAAIPAPAAMNAAPLDNTPGGSLPANNRSADQSRPGFDRQRDGNPQENGSASSSQPEGFRFNRNQSRFNNADSFMMPRSGPNTGMMIPNRPVNQPQAMGGMSFGGLFMGGGMMLFGLLFPLGFAALMVLGIIILYRMVRNPTPAATVSAAACTSCGASIQSGWKHCPHCGAIIE